MQVTSANSNKGCILVVDDNSTNRVLLTRALTKNGFVVLGAETGLGAVRMASEYQPDLMLLDIMMPDRDGMEACQLIKSDPRTANIPLIFATARSDREA